MAIAIFGMFWLAYHTYLTNMPRKLLVIVDSSYDMQTDWGYVSHVLESLNHERQYTQFSLYTEKHQIHDWSLQLRLGSILPYAPRSLVKMISVYNQNKSTANEVILLTNSHQKEIDKAGNWKIIRPGLKHYKVIANR